MRHHQRTTGRMIGYVLFVAVLTASFTLAPTARAQHFDEAKVTVGGHFDVRSVITDNNLSSHEFRVGQLGITVSSEFSRKITAGVELAYDRNEQIVVDEAFIDWTFFHRQRRFVRPQTAGLLQVGLKVGRFDVPFGIDWKNYSSFDRPLVTMPLVVINTHRGWNDVGGLFFGSTTWSNWAIWVVNAFGQSPALRCVERNRVPSLDSISESPIEEAFGLRTAIVVNDIFEIGTSFAAGYTENNVQDEKLIGFDIAVVYEGFEFKTEFIRQERFRTAKNEEDRKVVYGYYLQALYGNDRFFGVTRLDAYEPDNSEIYPLGITEDETVFCGSFGAGFKATQQAQIRVEYRLCERSHNDRAAVQAVVGF